MSTPNRLQVKLFFDETSNVPVKAFIPVFHNWIQRQETGDLLVDVHNYSHMHHGPGILLVAHESDYSIDLGGGRTGLVYRRKRSIPSDFDELLRLLFQRVAYGATQLEQDDSLPGSVRFLTDEAEISILDRLRYPNDADTYNNVEKELFEAVDKIFGEGSVTLGRVENDPRDPLAIRVGISAPPSLDELARSLKAGIAS